MMCKRLWIMLILVFLGLSTSWTCWAEEVLSLSQWIELAFVKNPDYQLFMADYQLAMQSLDYDERWGMKTANLSLSPVMVNNKGIQHNYGVGIQYSGLLPHKIHWSGSNMLNTDQTGKLQLSGSVQVGLNPRDLWNAHDDVKLRAQYLGELNRWREERASLIATVAKKYIILFEYQLRSDVNVKKEELAQMNLKKAEQEYAAGLISLMDLYIAEDAYRGAVKTREKVLSAQSKAVADFMQLYGEKVNDVKLGHIDDLQLPLLKVEIFLSEWDASKVESYLSGIYAHEQAYMTLRQSEEVLEKVKASDDWQFVLNASIDYDTKGSVDVQGTVGLSKELYNPAGHFKLSQAEIQLERQKLAYLETKKHLIEQIQTQVAMVWETRARLSEARDELDIASQRCERVLKQLKEGFVSEREVLQSEVTFIEKQLNLLQALQDEMLARLTLAQILNLDENVEIE